MGYKDYNAYLRSPHWHSVKTRFFKSKLIKRNKLKEPICTFCTRVDLPLHLHHRTYGRLGKEKLGDLVLLCELCHSLVHSIKATTLWKATDRAGKTIQAYIKNEDIKKHLRGLGLKEEALLYLKDITVKKLDKEAAKGFNFGSRSNLRKMVDT